MPPAARVTDPTTHGAPLSPGPGSMDVLIGNMPAWRALEDQHLCPAVSISGPDGAGMVMVGSPTVLIDFMMACRMGDIVVEIPGLAMGPADPIIMGCPTVVIGEVGNPSPGAVGFGAVIAGLAFAFNGIKGAVASILGFGLSPLAPVIDLATKVVAQAGAQFLAANPSAQQWLLEHTPSDSTQTQFDGMVIGFGCWPTAPDTVQTARGIRPAKCPVGREIPKVYFANGIDTKVYGPDASMCATMKKIADQTCAEVVGVYGASKGMVPDLDEAVKEIDKNSNSAQAKTLSKLMTDAADSDPPQDLNIVAHSRGGLATQEAIATTKMGLLADMPPEDADRALSHINVSAYGTAEQGWPVGPVYSKLNNVADPVPAAIKGAQSQFGDATLRDNDTTPTVPIYEPQPNPIDAHSVTDTYAKHMPMADGPRNCNCS